MLNQLLIFTDLDGTLLTHDDYSWQPAEKALARLRALKIPLIINSSKTAAEITQLRAELGNDHPYIVENGGALIMPAGSVSATDGQPPGEEIRVFGRNYQEIIQILEELRARKDYRFEGFADMGVSGIMQTTNLDQVSAEAAAKRHCTEPLLWHGNPAELSTFRFDLAKERLQLVRGGRFWHVMGAGDKGQAMTWLTHCYQRTHPQTKFTTVALGDGENDLPMLQAADTAVVIKPQTLPALQLGEHRRVLYPTDPGPAGWQQAIDEILNSQT